ncbi:MAG: hypothetical protein ACYDHN_12665 [Solirubrobacteraceae bacterium]
MQDPLAILGFDLADNGLSFVVFGTVAFSLLISLLLVLTRGSDNMYDQIGQGGLTPESELRGGALTQAPAPTSTSAEQEAEIRQMLRARSERQVRRGGPALDIDAELARLLAPQPGSTEHDSGLVEEVHQLVVARNERRVRQGLEPLDVQAEVARTLEELDP